MATKTFQVRNVPVALIASLKGVASVRNLTLSELVIETLTDASQHPKMTAPKRRPQRERAQPITSKPGHAINCKCYTCVPHRGPEKKGGKR